MSRWIKRWADKGEESKVKWNCEIQVVFAVKFFVLESLHYKMFNKEQRNYQGFSIPNVHENPQYYPRKIIYYCYFRMQVLL